MTTVQLCITVRPCVKEFVKREAKKRQLSVSRYIESKIYNDEEDQVYSIEELEKQAIEARKLSKDGKLLSFNTPEESLTYIINED